MGKELKALDIAIRYLLDEVDHILLELDEARECIAKQVLTPPTVDEVCKALSELNVLWDVKTKYLYRTVTTSAISYPIEVKLIELPPRLIIMLGKFYKGKQNE